jgi:hypothetical protein
MIQSWKIFSVNEEGTDKCLHLSNEATIYSNEDGLEIFVAENQMLIAESPFFVDLF